MKLFVSLCASFLAFASAKTTCPAAIWKMSIDGNFLDQSNYVRGVVPGPDNVLYIGDLTTNGDNTVINVNVPANKNNKALDVVIGDAWLSLEDGVDLVITPDNLVKVCSEKDCETKMSNLRPAFDYTAGNPVTCGKTCTANCFNQNCDYWGKEEDYSCKSLEQEYTCDCAGCQCTVDHKPCINALTVKKCNGKSCDSWISENGYSCTELEKDFKCNCNGCVCKTPIVCDAIASKKCSDAYKMPCKNGAKGDKSTQCGGCIVGYIPDSKGGCVAKPVSTAPPCPGTCGAAIHKGDGHCDDDNNNCGCQYDGGDCCAKTAPGGSVVTKYCKACQCLDPANQPGICPGQCGSAQYKGDGNCDDENNNCGCAYDGGDCCGTNVKTNYCKECKCKDPNYKPGSCTAKCGLPQYKGDGNCDDENNNCGCEYDGGDCCGSSVKTQYCKECKCKDPNYKPGACTATCGSPQYKGDGNCDDDNNNCGCAYDGGDCCGTSVKTQYCNECKCKDPNYKPPGNCPGSCGSPQYKGDGNCDDENNNCGCSYDGGDCCAKSLGGAVKTSYCKDCKCLDPANQPSGNCKATCGSPQYKGDGNCDDDNNNCGCSYDGGDCCAKSLGGAVKTAYCKECKCKDPTNQSSGNCPGTCGLAQYKGDGNCDDENNNCGCSYDGGDCCAKTVAGGTVKTAYCKVCQCADPASK